MRSFDSAKKVRFIELAHDAVEQGGVPHIANICKALGITVRTFQVHMVEDDVFKEAVDEAWLRVESELVDAMYANARKPNGVTDRIFLLKNRFPERWNENAKLIISRDNSPTKRLEDIAKGAIEGEIVVDKPKLLE